MASIRHEIVVDARPEAVWAAIADVGAVHDRLLPGRVAATRIEGEVRTLTFPDGHEIRELIVDIDDEARRLAYAVIEGGRPPLNHHHASFQVFDEPGGRSRLVWITDVLPNAHAPEIRIRVERGAEEMKHNLEASAGSVA
ncbi:SRPBCC family protein [Actinomadura fibrosa]|uniref:SRPBCC family protein n=1 Tax=Actinomadura fibrosa TaxID=111802 RepID=A0ABW2Y0T1_9ACTN|nr:SRPBCC family protein [Actinomadura fibrosa]